MWCWIILLKSDSLVFVILYLFVSPMTIPLWVPGGWNESAGTYSCLFVGLMYVFTLSLCARLPV